MIPILQTRTARCLMMEAVEARWRKRGKRRWRGKRRRKPARREGRLLSLQRGRKERKRRQSFQECQRSQCLLSSSSWERRAGRGRRRRTLQLGLEISENLWEKCGERWRINLSGRRSRKLPKRSMRWSTKSGSKMEAKKLLKTKSRRRRRRKRRAKRRASRRNLRKRKRLNLQRGHLPEAQEPASRAKSLSRTAPAGETRTETRRNLRQRRSRVTRRRKVGAGAGVIKGETLSLKSKNLM